MPGAMRSARRLPALILLALVVQGCGPDASTREYLTALRGEETGMTREQQIQHLDHAIALTPDRAFLYETRATYRIDLKQFDAALADLDRDIALLDRPYARFMRGLVWCQMGEYPRSLPDFDRAIAVQPRNTQFYRGRSLARLATGDAVGALADAEHLVVAVPQQAESYYARGMARARLGRDPEAIADFDRAAAIRPELVYVVEARAAAYARRGDDGRAAGDRHLADSLRAEQGGCAACLDPFRY